MICRCCLFRSSVSRRLWLCWSCVEAGIERFREPGRQSVAVARFRWPEWLGRPCRRPPVFCRRIAAGSISPVSVSMPLAGSGMAVFLPQCFFYARHASAPAARPAHPGDPVLQPDNKILPFPPNAARKISPISPASIVCLADSGWLRRVAGSAPHRRPYRWTWRDDLHGNPFYSE